jgi:hypothetical protein
VATANFPPLAIVRRVGNPIVARNTSGPAGPLGAAIVVALITLAVDGSLGLLQRALTPKGLTVGERTPTRRRAAPTLTPRSETP